MRKLYLLRLRQSFALSKILIHVYHLLAGQNLLSINLELQEVIPAVDGKVDDHIVTHHHFHLGMIIFYLIFYNKHGCK